MSPLVAFTENAIVFVPPGELGEDEEEHPPITAPPTIRKLATTSNPARRLRLPKGSRKRTEPMAIPAPARPFDRCTRATPVRVRVNVVETSPLCGVITAGSKPHTSSAGNPTQEKVTGEEKRCLGVRTIVNSAVVAPSTGTGVASSTKVGVIS